MQLKQKIRVYIPDFFVLRITSHQLPKIGSIVFVIVND